jgi:hypothetical protein
MLIALLYLVAFVGVPLLAAIYSHRIDSLVADLPTGAKRYLESHHWD